jgi:hypothetical protein
MTGMSFRDYGSVLRRVGVANAIMTDRRQDGSAPAHPADTDGGERPARLDVLDPTRVFSERPLAMTLRGW